MWRLVRCYVALLVIWNAHEVGVDAGPCGYRKEVGLKLRFVRDDRPRAPQLLLPGVQHVQPPLGHLLARPDTRLRREHGVCVASAMLRRHCPRDKVCVPCRASFSPPPASVVGPHLRRGLDVVLAEVDLPHLRVGFAVVKTTFDLAMFHDLAGWHSAPLPFRSVWLLDLLHTTLAQVGESVKC